LRVFLDANILFSAAITPSGVSAGIVEASQLGVATLLSSPLAIEEAERNLRAKGTQGLQRWVLVRGALRVTPEASTAIRRQLIVELPDHDRAVLAAAVAGRANLFVSGDRRHFGSLFGASFGVTLVAPPRAALDLLLGELEVE
jgi:predicted nucleic acid-binding protein